MLDHAHKFLHVTNARRTFMQADMALKFPNKKYQYVSLLDQFYQYEWMSDIASSTQDKEKHVCLLGLQTYVRYVCVY